MKHVVNPIKHVIVDYIRLLGIRVVKRILVLARCPVNMLTRWGGRGVDFGPHYSCREKSEQCSQCSPYGALYHWRNNSAHLPPIWIMYVLLGSIYAIGIGTFTISIGKF